MVGRDSSVDTATRYGLDGPGIESRWGRDFPHPSRPVAGPWYRVSFPGVKRPGRGVDHPSPSNAAVKERVELYLFSPCGPSWPVVGCPLPLPLFSSLYVRANEKPETDLTVYMVRHTPK